MLFRSENLRTLQQDFPDLKLIKLEQNYRSSTRILQAANAVIGNNPKLFEKVLWSEHGPGDPIKVLAMDDDEAEADQVAGAQLQVDGAVVEAMREDLELFGDFLFDRPLSRELVETHVHDLMDRRHRVVEIGRAHV